MYIKHLLIESITKNSYNPYNYEFTYIVKDVYKDNKSYN